MNEKEALFFDHSWLSDWQRQSSYINPKMSLFLSPSLLPLAPWPQEDDIPICNIRKNSSKTLDLAFDLYLFFY